MKRRNFGDSSIITSRVPGYLHLNSHQPSALISDTLILDTLLSLSQDVIYFKDVDSRFILNNGMHARLFGKNDPRELTGKSDADFYPREQADIYRQEELRIMQTGIPLLDRVQKAVNANGEPVVYSSRKFPLYDQNGNTIGTWGISRDITKLVEAEEKIMKVNAKLAELALIDDLSGLYNQRHFNKVLKTNIDLYTRKRLEGVKANFCLLYLDVDGFKQINDIYGHVTGDAVIRHIGSLLASNVRSSDTAFRYGGDEFAIILQDINIKIGRVLGDRLRSIIEQNPLVMEGHEIPLSASLGIIDYNNEKTISELVKKADAKLYQAKSEGRNCLRG